MSIDRLVVVGGSLAGLRAVEAARRAGHRGAIALICGEDHPPYDRLPLSKGFLDECGEVTLGSFRSEAELDDDLDVELILGEPATGLDVGGKVVHVGGRAVRYDALVIATGATPRLLPGTREVDGVHYLRNYEDALAIREALDAGARTVIAGSGFIGSEVASAARKRGLPATVVDPLPVPLSPAIGLAAGEACARLHRAAGTELITGVGLSGVRTESGRVTGVELSDGRALDADLVVIGIGVVPATDWLRDSGLALHERDGGVICDPTLAVGPEGVYAAGDVAHVQYPLFGDRLIRVEHWATAAAHGAMAARHALDPQRAEPQSVVPYFWSDWYGHGIQGVGITDSDEITVAWDVDEGFMALYRHGDRIVGALTIDRRSDIMKLRRRIAERGAWDEALEYAGSLGARSAVLP